MADNGDEDEAPGGGWLISYADLMTLLFAAFVVLYGITPQGESKEVLGVLSSIREAFVEIPDIIPDEERAGPLKKGKFVFKNFKGDTSRPPLIKQYLSADKAVNVINRDMQEAKNVINLLNKKAETKPGAITKPEAISVHRDANGWRFRLVASHFFKPGQFRMEREALATLDTVGNYLKSIGQMIFHQAVK
jgi:chemotaxis protein MotB